MPSALHKSSPVGQPSGKSSGSAFIWKKGSSSMSKSSRTGVLQLPQNERPADRVVVMIVGTTGGVGGHAVQHIEAPFQACQLLGHIAEVLPLGFATRQLLFRIHLFIFVPSPFANLGNRRRRCSLISSVQQLSSSSSSPNPD
ncbi:hypothetical protein TYRP_005503 [Tyrophagus putrescentiae]|nr:hypothetical protein TYRP_005503 [Tyrophagus putrescentiae]